MDPTETVQLVAGGLRVAPEPASVARGICLRLEGQLDAASALALARLLLDAQRNAVGPLVLDVSRLSFVDVAGLRVLVDAGRRAWHAGEDLLLRRPSPNLCRLFRLTGLPAWTVLRPDGLVAAALPPQHRLVVGHFGRPALN
jgi:anti-anti-sigma factor